MRSLPQPLSPDANLWATAATADGFEHAQRGFHASTQLVTDRCDALCEAIAARGPLGSRCAVVDSFEDSSEEGGGDSGVKLCEYYVFEQEGEVVSCEDRTAIVQRCDTHATSEELGSSYASSLRSFPSCAPPPSASRGFGFSVSEEVHRRGVNLRHLGLIRARF